MKKKGCLTCAYRGKWEGFMPCKNWNRRAVFYCNKYGCSHAAIKTKCKDWKNSETPVKKYHWVFVTMTVCALPDLRRNAIVNFIRAYGTKQTLFAGGSIVKTDDILTSYEKFCDKV